MQWPLSSTTTPGAPKPTPKHVEVKMEKDQLAWGRGGGGGGGHKKKSAGGWQRRVFENIFVF